ncbi:Acetyl-CoA biotin carboxyl carrier [Pseudobythopirellula maris]|uniref:Biotin carboxyl carrier protein of acetyl-CoA carboxylase n=1 Tax=Pseudobythopirellula maris TaxID=2527991 RepID=A0A5C5ZIC3_9BACT|nr:acetyl-CoA carboxylase biotin carboxyl carrier protein [Pseudobythopirellula maris]TWT86938.1 Acetyl-CoA biotin carboxyl carrier [Pseudobythopirellula maris]
MASEKDPAGAGDVFDVSKVRQLVELMNDHDLAEIVLQQGEQKMKLRRGGEPVTIAATPAQPAPALAAPAAAPSAAPAPAPSAAPAADAAAEVIPSPMVGTFYTSANPESAAFVKPGDQVGPDTTICIIEAMKVFNEIPADCSGKIVAVLVENGAAVEFGQPLFKIEKG